MVRGKRILIVDDDPDLIDLLESYFKKAGYEVEGANNGKDALQKIENNKYDLVLLDVMMPYIDGYHVAYEVTSKYGQYAPRIIIMTSRDVSAEKGIAFLSGAHSTVQKPFSLEELGKQVETALSS